VGSGMRESAGGSRQIQNRKNNVCNLLYKKERKNSVKKLVPVGQKPTNAKYKRGGRGGDGFRAEI